MSKSDQKINISRYCIIPRVLIFLFYKDNILLMKVNKRESSWYGYYNGLGGHVEKGEDILSAARREALEESGAKVKYLTLTGVGIVDVEPNIGVGLFVVKGEVEEKQIKPSKEGLPEWIPLRNLDEWKILPDTKELINKITAKTADREPFSFLLTYDEKEELRSKYYTGNRS